MKKKNTRNTGEKTVEKHIAKSKKATTIIERAKAYSDIRKSIDNRVLTGAIMEQIRLALGVPQAAVARDMGVSITAFRQWESGQSVPSEDKYRMLQDYFCVYTDDDVKVILSEGEKITLSLEEIESLDDLMDSLTDGQN